MAIPRRQLLLAGLLSPFLGNSATRRPLTAAAFPSVDAILKEAEPDWRALRPDVDLEIVSREYTDHHTAMVTSIATRSHLPAVMALELSFLGRFVNSGALEDLSRPPYNALGFSDRFVPFAVRQASTPAGGLMAIPADIAPGAMFYRHDLLTRSGVTEAELTASWESFVEAGARIKAATGAFLIGHAQELKDVVIRTNLGPGEGVYLDRTGRVLVESARFRRAFELARRVRAQRLDGKIGTWSTEWSEALRRGGVATQTMGAWFAGHLENWLAPMTRGLWRSAPLPDGAHNAWGGTFYAIPKEAPDKPLAWELIRLMTLDRRIQLAGFRSHGAFPALLAAHQDPFFEQPIPFLGGQKARLQWREAAAAIPPFPVHKLDPIAAEIVDSALDEVLEGRSIDSALADARILVERRATRG
jgi:multiple sugar transport system substrate-binding protein